MTIKKTRIPLFILPIVFSVHLSAQSEIIQGDLTVEGTTELQGNAEIQGNTQVKGDLRIVGSQSEIFLGNDGLTAIQSFNYPGTVGVFWDPQQMALRVGRAFGNEWASPWGLYSMGLGYNVKPTGTHSVALNQSTTAAGGSALATGKLTSAGGDASVSMGVSTQAQAYASVVLGSYNQLLGQSHNQWISSDPLFVIGNGTAWNNRRNAVTVLKDGRVGIGTSSPNTLLHVNGTARFSNALFTDGPLVLNGPVYSNNSNSPFRIAGKLKVGQGSSVHDLSVDGDVHWTGSLQGGDVPWARLTEVPLFFPPSNHSHPISQVSGLEGALDSKLNVSGGTVTGNLEIEGSLTLSEPTLNVHGATKSYVDAAIGNIDTENVVVSGKVSHAGRHVYTHRYSSTQEVDTLVKLGEFTIPTNSRQVVVDGYVTSGSSQMFEKEHFTFQFRRHVDADTYDYSFRTHASSGNTGSNSERVDVEVFSDDANPTRVIVTARYRASNHHLFAHYEVFDRNGGDLYIQASQHSPEVLASDAIAYTAFLADHTRLDLTGGVHRINGDLIAQVPARGGILMGEFGN